MPGVFVSLQSLDGGAYRYVTSCHAHASAKLLQPLHSILLQHLNDAPDGWTKKAANSSFEYRAYCSITKATACYNAHCSIIPSQFLIPLSDSSFICTVSAQWLVILDSIIVITFNIYLEGKARAVVHLFIHFYWRECPQLVAKYRTIPIRLLTQWRTAAFITVITFITALEMWNFININVIYLCRKAVLNR